MVTVFAPPNVTAWFDRVTKLAQAKVIRPRSVIKAILVTDPPRIFVGRTMQRGMHIAGQAAEHGMEAAGETAQRGMRATSEGARECSMWPGFSLMTLSLSVKPGARLLTQMLCSPSSRDTERVNAVTAPFEVT